MTQQEYLTKRKKLLDEQANAHYKFWCANNAAACNAAERELEHLEQALRLLDKEYNEALRLDNTQK